MDKLRQNVLYLLAQNNCSQKQLSIGISEYNVSTTEATLSKILNGLYKPKLHIVIAFSKFFNVSLDALCFSDLSKQSNDLSNKSKEDLIVEIQRLHTIIDENNKRKDDLKTLYNKMIR